jgi:hypothetical protein
MHFSTLALFIITLPAAAYAAAYPEPFPGLKRECIPAGSYCNGTVPCCQNLCRGVGRFRGNVSDALSLTDEMLGMHQRLGRL